MSIGDTITLKIRRSQRATMLAGNPIFILDARADVSPDRLALIQKYKMGNMVVYDSKERAGRSAEAAGHYQDAYVASYSSVGKMAWQGLKGAAAQALATLALRVTIDSLIKGHHIECKELDELLAAETAMHNACQTLKIYLDTALSFDGRELVFEI